MAQNLIGCDRDQELLLPGIGGVLREAKQALEAERAAKANRIPRDRAERLAECKQRLEQDWALERKGITDHAPWHARGIASDGSRRMAGARANIKPYPLTDKPAGKLNVGDRDSRNLSRTLLPIFKSGLQRGSFIRTRRGPAGGRRRSTWRGCIRLTSSW